MSSITIGRHGVNHSVEICFWCGKDKGVALFGKLPTSRAQKMFGKEHVRDDHGEAEAPRKVIMGLEPCGDDCEVWKRSKEGVFFIEATHDEKAARPTGSFTLVKEEAVHRLLNPGPVLNEALRRRMLYIHPEDYAALFADAKAKD